jgi:hypothetical protein
MKKSSKKVLTKILITSHDVVILAAFQLGASQKAIDTEDIAVKASELAPGRFSWRKYPDQINLELVRVTLSDLKKGAYSGLLSGSGRSGWTITAKGLEWINQNEKRLLRSELGRAPEDAKFGSIDSAREQRERKRLKASKAWGQWLSEPSKVSRTDAESVLRVDSYTTDRAFELKINRLKTTFRRDKEMSRFLDHMVEILREK